MRSLFALGVWLPWLFMGLSACIATDTQQCADGTLCSDGRSCVVHQGQTLCLVPGVREACRGLPEGTPCTFLGADLELHTCTDGLCRRGGCGDGRIDPDRGEECDGDNVGGDSCDARGYYFGQVVCSSDCTLNATGCTGFCGNGVLEPGEFCDVEQHTLTCKDIGYYGGTLECAQSHLLSAPDPNANGCLAPPTGAGCDGYCGDGVLQLDEPCDGEVHADSNGCLAYGAVGGTLGCSKTCTPDPSTCETAGYSRVAGVEVLGAITGMANPVTSDTFWLSATGGRLYFFDGEVFAEVPLPGPKSDLNDVDVFGLGFQDETVWLAGDDGRVVQGSSAVGEWTNRFSEVAIDWQSIDAAFGYTAVGGDAGYVGILQNGQFTVFQDPEPGVGSIRDMRVGGPADPAAYMVSDQGLRYFDGTTFTQLAFAGQSLNGLHVANAGHILVVGDQGLLRVWTQEDGERDIPTGVTEDLLAITKGFFGDFFVAGRGPVALRYNTADEQLFTIPVDGIADLFAVEVTQSDVWVAGEAGEVLRLAGSTFEPMATTVSPAPSYNGVWGLAMDDAVAIDALGGIVRWDGAGWKPETVPAAPGCPVSAYGGIWSSDADDVWVVGDDGAVAHRSADGWTAECLDAAAGRALSAVWGVSSDRVYAVGGGGAAFVFDGGAWGALPGLPTEADLHAVWAWDEDHLFIGGDGVLLQFDGQTWVSTALEGQVFGLWGSSPTNVVAVGSGGQVWRHDIGGVWSLEPSGTLADLRAVSGRNAFDIYAVGDSARVIHYDGAAWWPMESASSGDYRAVWTARDMPTLLAGSDGVIQRRVTSPPHFSVDALCPATDDLVRVYCGTELVSSLSEFQNLKVLLGPSCDEVGIERHLGGYAAHFWLDAPIVGEATVQVTPHDMDVAVVVTGPPDQCTHECLGASDEPGLGDEVVTFPLDGNASASGRIITVEGVDAMANNASFTMTIECTRQ